MPIFNYLAVFRRIHKKRVHLAVIILMPISRGWAQNPILDKDSVFSVFDLLNNVRCSVGIAKVPVTRFIETQAREVRAHVTRPEPNDL